MEKDQIIALSKKNINLENLEKAKKILESDYEISFGSYENSELRKAISEKNPVIIENHFLIGYDLDGKFVDINDKKISIERMIKAIIIEQEIVEKIPSIQEDTTKDYFAIFGKNEWIEEQEVEGNKIEVNKDLGLFFSLISTLRLGEIFLPPHSAIFNFLKPTDDTKKRKVVSMLQGININIYEYDDYFDNCIHEIGHLFWRTCLLFEEKEKFKSLFKRLKPSSIYVYEWERKTEEEVFCTIYKWYVKSLLLNKSFYNILEYEEPEGLALLQAVFDRIARDRIKEDIFNLNRDIIIEYLNPKLDRTTGKYIIKKEIREKVEDIELPRSIINNPVEMSDGSEYIKLGKARVPIKNNKIDFEKFNFIKMEKATSGEKPTVYVDIDGVVADFVKGYKDYFLRDAYKDDPFTISQQCMTMPNFFRVLPVLPKGMELIESLKDNYRIVFLTTPMNGMIECKRNKLEWIYENFKKQYTVIFSENKSDYVIDEKSVLIDDFKDNLKQWEKAGGTGINFNQGNGKILDTLKEIFDDQKQIKKVQDQLDTMEVDTNPTLSQKEKGNYKKGEIDFKGIKIKIENPKGSIRWGLGDDGKKWIHKMKHHYGYIVHDGAAGDGDKIDCFIGPKLNASRVFVVNQVNPWTGQFDEHKVMFGFDTMDEAEQAYRDAYKKEWEGFDSIKKTNTKEIRKWIAEGNLNERF